MVSNRALVTRISVGRLLEDLGSALEIHGGRREIDACEALD